MPRKSAAGKVPKLKFTVTRESRLLHRLGEIGAEAGSPAGLLKTMLDEISKSMGVPIAAVELYNEATQAMQFRAIRGLELMEAELELQMPVEFALSGMVVQTGRPLLENDPERSGEFWMARGMKSYLGYPMMAGGRCVGTLSLAHPEKIEPDTAFQKCAIGLAQWLGHFVVGQLFRESGEPAGVILQRMKVDYEQDVQRLKGLLHKKEAEQMALIERARASTAEATRAKRMHEHVRRELQDVSSQLQELAQLRNDFELMDRQLRDAQHAIRSHSMQDEQTGLPNETLFRYLFTQALARSRRHKEMIGLLYIDLDHFQELRNRHGEEFADQVLKQIADRLQRNVREGDTAARMGLDEFVWCISNLQDMEDLAIIAEKMLAIASRSVTVDGKDYTLSASIGISVYPFDSGDVDSLIQQAVTALIRAKELGRNTFQFYTEEVNSRLRERLVLKKQLHEALAKHEFVLHYQPVLSVAHRRIEGLEVLLRWKNPDGKLAYPEEFLKVSEETGLIAPLDEWVLRNACIQMMKWSGVGRGGNLFLAVNISRRLFQEIDFPVKLAAILRETSFSPQRLEIEVTQETLAGEIERSAMNLRSLRELGVRVSIDDFGTGTLSLNHMKLLPVTAVKLDHSFTRNLPVDAANAAMVTGIISMAHALGVHVVAEGVEVEGEYQFLRSARCDLFQGHLFRPAVPADSIADLLQEETAEFEVEISLDGEDADLEFEPIETTVPMPAPLLPVSPGAVRSEMVSVALPAHIPARSAIARNYIVQCCNCRNQFDAMETAWCSCLVTERTLVCPHCMDCFCKAPLEFKLDFWTEAPQSMWDRRVEEEQKHMAPAANPAPEEIKRPLVLVLDDERPILSMASHLIHGLGYAVITGTNGEEGLELARAYRPEIILSDALMPRMDGREMCRKIKTDPDLSRTKVVIMTSLSTRPRDRSTAYKEFRMDEFLQKPLAFNQLRKVLEKYLAGSS